MLMILKGHLKMAHGQSDTCQSLPYVPEHLLARHLIGPCTTLCLTDVHHLERTSRAFRGYIRALRPEERHALLVRALCNQMPQVTKMAAAEAPGILQAVVRTRNINVYNLCMRQARLGNLHANMPKCTRRLSRMIMQVHEKYPVVTPGASTDPETSKETLKFTLSLVDHVLEHMVSPTYRHKRHSHMPIHMVFCCAAITVVFELVNNMWASGDASFQSPRLHQVTLDKAREIKSRIMRVRGHMCHPHLVHLMRVADACIANMQYGPLQP